MAECQIAEFFLNGLSPHVTFDDLQKKDAFHTFKKQIARQIILDQKLYLLNSITIRRKKLPNGRKKIRLFARYAKSPLFLHIFVHSASVSVFGLRPDVFPARYSVLA
jgi:hypothetical protein